MEINNANLTASPYDGRSFIGGGLTKREYTAIKIFAAIVSDSGVADSDDFKKAVEYTDKLLAQLEKIQYK